MQSTCIFTIAKLLRAYRSCRKRKRSTINAIKFELRSERKLLNLHRQLIQRTYRPDRSICFIVTYPKTREIFAAEFADRIIHHLLVSEIEPFFERRFIYNSFACRSGKGTHTAVVILQKSLRKVTSNMKKPAFYGHFDIASFFTKIDRQILYDILERLILKLPKSPMWKDEILYVTKIICFHDPTESYYLKGRPELFHMLPIQKSLFGNPEGKGLPIGNLTSQFFANVYLDPLDQFAKRILKIKYYFRYVDDIVVLSQNKEEIYKWGKQIQNFITQNLEVDLHPDKTHVGSVYQGIDFLGYFVKPKYILVRKRVVKTFKSKLYNLNLNQNKSEFTIHQSLAVINSYFAHFSHAHSYKLRKCLYRKHLTNFNDKIKPQNRLRSFRPRKPTR